MILRSGAYQVPNPSIVIFIHGILFESNIWRLESERYSSIQRDSLYTQPTVDTRAEGVINSWKIIVRSSLPEAS